MSIALLQKKLKARYPGFQVREEDRCLIVTGHSSDWDEIIAACQLCVSPKKGYHVINDVTFEGAEIPPMRVPDLKDDALEGKTPDVLIIGGGISGCSIARELSRYRLSILLVDKESDVALHASGRNDGEVHPGVDLPKGTLKQHYVVASNRMYQRVCKELDVPFRRVGQVVGFFDRKMKPLVKLYAWQRRHVCGVDDSKVISRQELRKREPCLNKDFAFALENPMAGIVSPYGLTIAYAENAVQNGAEISLNTAVLGMEVKDGKIVSVHTNRGTVHPKIVINAAGVFAEEIAKMAGDRFYSIHPRRGTDTILDSKASWQVKEVASWKDLKKQTGHTKGGGILPTTDGNLLVGPDAVETYEKEDFATDRASLNTVFGKQTKTLPTLSRGDIITYFTGVRAATFEEDYVLEEGRKTKNLIHCAGIQSPGLTTAPAVAIDMSKMAVRLLEKLGQPVSLNPNFRGKRKGIPRVKDLPDDEKDALIRKNPDYGVIVCRCEQISKGEIIDAIHNPLGVVSLDAIKKRVRPGMGRCQGAFCSPWIVQIISEETGIPPEKVCKGNDRSPLFYGKTKEVTYDD